jgi:regulatory protein
MRVWEEAPFHEGEQIDAARWETILRETEQIRARGQALSLLARAEHSRFLLRRKLLARDLDPVAIDSTLDSLEADDSLSDLRYAESWVRGRLRSHPEGRAHLVGGLRSRGIDAALAERAVASVLSQESVSMVDAARELVGRLTRRKALSPQAIADRLYRRGFSSEVVREVLSERQTGQNGPSSSTGIC